MKILIAGVASAVVMTGVAGSVAAYRLQAGEVPESEPAVAASEPAPQAEPAPRKVKVRWAPCEKGSTLEKGVCVTDVTRTVVLPAPASAPAPRQPARVARDDDDRDERGDDEGSEEGDDHEDDDEGHGDDDGDDHEDDDDDHGDDHGDDDESGEDDDD